MNTVIFSDRLSLVSIFAVTDGVTLKKQQLSKSEIGLRGPSPFQARSWSIISIPQCYSPLYLIYISDKAFPVLCVEDFIYLARTFVIQKSYANKLPQMHTVREFDTCNLKLFTQQLPCILKIFLHIHRIRGSQRLRESMNTKECFLKYELM